MSNQIKEDKITKTLIEKKTGYSKNQIAYMNNHYPRCLALLQKGLLFEMIENGKVDEYSDDVVSDIRNETLQKRLIRKSKTKRES